MAVLPQLPPGIERWIRQLEQRVEKLERYALKGEAWHLVEAAGEPGFENGWVNYDGAGAPRNAGFRIDPFGVVHLKGIIKDGTLGTVAFTLPSGYRPPAGAGDDPWFAAVANVGFGSLNVLSTGGVRPWNGSNVWFSLYGISFRTS